MAEPPSSPTGPARALRVAAGEDRFGERRGLDLRTIAFKVVPQDSAGLLIVETSCHGRGGPARHLHNEQDEWLYVLEGEFIIEVGEERFDLKLGDSILVPRRVPHVWACVGDGFGRILITFMPAGNMEAFFREMDGTPAKARQNPELRRAYGMELIGPPLPIE